MCAPRAMGSTLAASLLVLCVLASAGRAQFSGFGKNKVQYDNFDWQRMETPHFDLFFYPEEEELAGYAARMAEEDFYDLEKKFAHTVQRRVPIILYSSHIFFEQTNVIPSLLPEGVAGFTEFLKGRVTLPMGGSLAEFARVLHHELVHVFMFDIIHKTLKRHAVTEPHPAPLWFSEGLAEFWSGEWDSNGDMVIRDAMFSERLMPIGQMRYINGSYQMYKEGQSICAYMAEKYGEDIFQVMFENWWRGEDFAEIFEISTGEALSKFDGEWQYHLRKYYLPDIGAADPPGKLAKALTRRGFNLKPEVVAGAGDSIEVVFFSNQQGYTQVVRAALQGGEQVVVAQGERSSEIESLHPLYTRPAASADGRWLAFVAKGKGRDHLYVWDLRTLRESERFQFEGIVALSTPSFSPRGDKIVFAGTGRDGFVDLYVVDRESGALERLTHDIYHDRDPDWSPEGERIVFSSDRWEGGRKGYYNLFLYQFEDGSVRPLTRGRHNDLQPAWSPGGEQVAFCSDRDKMYNLYTLKIEEKEGGMRTGLRRATHALTGAFDPVWLPDQSGLLFTGYERGRFNVYRMELPSAPSAVDSSQVTYASPDPDAVQSWKMEGEQEHSPFIRKKYKRKLSLDIASSQISQDPQFGSSGGIQVLLSDVLGNDQFGFVLSHITGSQAGFLDGLNVAFARTYLARQLNVSWGFFRLNDRLNSRFGRFVRERRTGGFLSLSFPFSMFDRLETRISLRRADIDRQFEGRHLKAWLMENALSYTHDSSLWIPTGPIDGTRYRFGLSQSVDFKTSRRFNLSFFGDYRHYFRLSRRSSFAVRFMGRHSRGPVPEFFPLGGSWTLRGYPFRSIWGRNLVLINNELRFPLLDRLVVAFPFGNIDFSAFRGALFVDGGNAWNDSFGQWKGSIGAGTRLALGGVFVFRLDASRRTDFRSVERTTRWTFFFGWDF